MELKPKQELFAQALIKHNLHQTKAYLELHPYVKEASARHSASILLTNVYIKLRVYEILEQNGLGFKEVAKKLSDLMNYKSYYYKSYKSKRRVLGDNIGIQIDGLKLIIRFYEALLKSGAICFTSEEMAQIEQMTKDLEALNQKKQDDPNQQ